MSDKTNREGFCSARPPLPYGRQDIIDADVTAVADALREPFLTQGPGVLRFEQALAEAVGARYAVAVNSGTAALHAAYFAAGIGPGKSILTTPITFAATANAALYLGGAVRFADIDDTTALLDPMRVAQVAGGSVAALVPVHLGGQVAAMPDLAAIADRHGWVVIEDAAHAIGARYTAADGREHRVGACAHSAMCCFSFHPVKHITTGEGGAVTTNDETFYRRLLHFRTHGITRDPQELIAAEGGWYYEQHDLGYNYRITDFQCALGLVQLRRLPQFVERRRAIAARYDGAFADVRDARPLAVPAWSRGSYHLYIVRVPARMRRAVYDALRAAEVGVNVHYIPVYRHPYYRANGFAGFQLPRAEAYYAEALTLPMYPGLADADVDRIVEDVRRALAEATPE